MTTSLQAFFDAIQPLASGRVFPLVAPEAVIAPFIVYQPVSGERVLGLGGDHRLERLRVQVDTYAKTLNEALSLQRSVRESALASVRLADAQLMLTEFDTDAKLYRAAFDYTYHF